MLFTFRTASLFILSSLIFLLSACQVDNSSNSQKDSTTTSSKQNLTAETIREVPSLRPVVSAGDEKIVQPAFLRDHLPESVFAYARIPNIWSFVGSAKQNVFNTATNAQAFVDVVNSIRNGVSDNVIPDIPDEDAQIFFRLILQQLTSPIEAIAIEGVDPAIPTPNLVVTAKTSFKTVAEVQQVLELLAKKIPELEVSKAMQTDGYAELIIAKMNGQLKWNQESSRLTLLLGVSLSPNNLTDLIQTFKTNSTHQMKAIESTIDSSGQGSFVWANPRKLSNIGSALGMQRELAPLAMMGVSSMKNIAAGLGTSGGINRLKYVVEMPVTGFRSYMPIIKATPSFDVMGKTKMVGVLGLPSRSDFMSIENTIALVTKSDDMEEYYKVKKEFSNKLGFEIEDIFDFFGQDISFVSDQAGSYVAIKLNQADKFKATLEKSVETLKLDYQQRVIGEHTYHHLKIPSILSKSIEEDAKKKNKPVNKLLKRFFGVPTHLYWEQEGDYLILANIPQTLIDRHYIKTKTSVKDWLENKQRINADGSLMMVSLRNEGTAKKMYRMHLGALNYLADFSGKPIDMFALATPHEAKIPKQSSYGFKVTSTQTQLAFELNFESNPYEFLLAGSAYESIAVIGILASIAMPAYADYETRAKLSVGIVAAEMIKGKLNEFEIEYGRYPNQFEIDDMKLNEKKPSYTISVSENTGEINVKFKDIKLRNRNTLKMIPPKQGISITWRCEAKINKKYLPSSCKKKKLR